MEEENDELDFNLEPILKAYAAEVGSSETRFELDSLLNLIKKNQSRSEYALRFLKQLKKNVPLIRPDVFESNLVNVVLFDIKWPVHYSRDPRVLSRLLDVLVELNSAYTSYVYKSLVMVVKCMFTVANTESNDNDIDCEAVYAMGHALVDYVLKMAPASHGQLVKIVEQSYPYMLKETQVQRAFITNVLRMATAHRSLRLPLLEQCVQKLLKIDVNLSLEHVEAEIEADKIQTTDNEDEDAQQDAKRNRTQYSL